MRKNPADKIIERLEPDPAKQEADNYCTADLEWFGVSNFSVTRPQAIKWIGKLLDFWRDEHRQALAPPMTAAQREKLQRTVRHLEKLETLKREVQLSDDTTVELSNRLFAETNFRVSPAKVAPVRRRSRTT